MKLLQWGSMAVLSTWVGFDLQAQIAWDGSTYSQDFDSLAAEGSDNPWIDNLTLPGWYAAAGLTFGGDYRAGTGTSTTGDLYSFGLEPLNDRALGSLASGGTGNLAYGVRLVNNTGQGLANVSLSYTGEQWRNGAAGVQRLSVSYRTSPTAIIDPDVANSAAWTSLSALDFVSPIEGGTTGALDGNASANRILLSGSLDGLVLQSGEELFVRWADINDSTADHGLALDNFSLTATAVPESDHLLGIGFALLAIGVWWKRWGAPEGKITHR